jgi:hypothetical protein
MSFHMLGGHYGIRMYPKGGGSVMLDAGRNRKPYKVVSADMGGKLTVEHPGGASVDMSMSRLSDRQKAMLTVSICRSGNEEDHALAGFYLMLMGRQEQARKHLDRAGGSAEAVRAAFAQ